MVIKCNNCSYKEALNKRFFFKLLGGGMVGFGFWAWVAYIFAGTGFALPICIAIVVGGAATAAFSNEIAEWVSTIYECPRCKQKNWSVVDE